MKYLSWLLLGLSIGMLIGLIVGVLIASHALGIDLIQPAPPIYYGGYIA